MNQAHKLIEQSYHFIQPSEALKNAIHYNYAQRERRAAEYLAKKHTRPTRIDIIKNYIRAIV